MSAICQNFSQNAWKKELCSNCFKSKDEHNQPTIKKPLPITSQRVVGSIIKCNIQYKKKTQHTVSFTNEIAHVIGYGGEDWSESEEDIQSDDEVLSIQDSDLEFDGEEDKELQRLTKENTDFNTVNANLLNDSCEMKKSYTHLKLGTPQIDADGRKQTLLVSVTPFGHDNGSSAIKKISKTISHIPVVKCNKEAIIDNRSNAVLTSYTTKNDDNIFKEEKSLLEEISETLEKSKTPIQIITRKREVPSATSEKNSNDKNKENKNDVNIQKNSTYILENTGDKCGEKIKDLKSNKTNIPERKNGLTRTPAIKKDQEKPVIYQTSTAKIELLNNKNLKLTKETSKIILESFIKTNTEKFTFKENVANSSIDTVIDQIPFSNGVNIELIQDTVKTEDDTKNVNTSENKDYVEYSLNEANTSLTESIAENQDQTDSIKPLEKLSLPLTVPIQTREQAGEPDGHADPDGTNEPPALPTTPPPIIESRTSFLHCNSLASDKPKLPIKPATVLIRKPVIATNQHTETQAQQLILTTFTTEVKSPDPEKVKLDKQDSNSSDVCRTTNKRRAPKPPFPEDVSMLYSRNSTMNVNIDSPIIKEKEKRGRASSCSPSMHDKINSNPNGSLSNISITPEPAPRKSLSLSIDSLAGVGIDEKKKDKSKARFSLKKFLRMSSSKDLHKQHCESPKYEEVKFVEPQPKPRLVIVHPLELNGAKVEVVSKPISSCDNLDFNLSTHMQHNEYDIPRSISLDHHIHERPVKPSPPPRNLDDWNQKNKPNLPHPPKSIEVINKQKYFDKTAINNKKIDTVYANIGEVRSAIIPNKPQRTASMREREAIAAKQQQKHLTSDNFEGTKENVYDYIHGAGFSSPDYSDVSPDKNSPTNQNNKLQRLLQQARSSSNMDVSGDYCKFQNIPRSASLTYCGSETESEIYSPYSYYGSESEVAEDDRDWAHNGRTYKLRSRKGRSIVHKNLEDNYGAVIVANHEALAQVLENIQQVPLIQSALRGLKSITNLRWTDFSIKENISSLTVGPRVFHQAVWGAHHVTLLIISDSTPASSPSLGTFNLAPITEFTDLIPSKYVFVGSDKESTTLIQASIAVLPWMQVNTIQTYTDLLKSKSTSNSPEELFKDACFIMLQLINALKMLQAQGIEELPLSLTSFIICREMEKDSHHRLCVLQGLGEEISHKMENTEFGSLCSCATTVLSLLLPNTRLTSLLYSVLSTERAVSLTQVKSILEFSLWGPSDVPLSTNIKERELALQRWLDLQRATVLHGLVCTRIYLTVYEECHLLFLVRSNAKMMCDASLLFDSSSRQVLQ